MKSTFALVCSATILVAGSHAPAAFADQTIRCASNQYHYAECPIPDHGYVRLQRQTSKSACTQGRTWDYDRRHIWVDDGCAGEFLVETRYHTDDHPDHNGDKAVAAAAGLAILAAAAIAASKDDHHDDNRYSNSSYYHGGHSSYVPNWMVGNFRGYNMNYHQQVSVEITSDGRAYVDAAGNRLQGYVNDERLYVGNLEFDIERAGGGFNTIQVGNRHNQVHYERD